jgi:hypothetical protein
MTQRLISTNALIIFALLSACGLSGPGERERVQEFDGRGRYVFGFEASLFVPCGDTQQWWVTSLDSVPAVQTYVTTHQRPNAESGVDYVTAFVSWRGLRSAAGRYGHLDGYVYQFVPYAIHEVRDTAASDCH